MPTELAETSENRDRQSTAPATPEPAANSEHVLAEMSHELGNLFHKLYYCAERLRSDGAAGDRDVPATELLEHTIKHLEDFLRVALQYFSPVEMNPIRLTAGDVLRSFIGQVSARMCGTPLEVRSEPTDHLAVLVDPGRLSQALEIAVRHLTQQVGDESRLTVAMQKSRYDDRPCVELRTTVAQVGNQSSSLRTAAAGVEWALMEKLFRSHGGGLRQHAGEVEERGFSIFIPLAG